MIPNKYILFVMLLIFIIGGLVGGWITYAVKKCPPEHQPIILQHENARIDTLNKSDLRNAIDSTLSGK